MSEKTAMQNALMYAALIKTQRERVLEELETLREYAEQLAKAASRAVDEYS